MKLWVLKIWLKSICGDLQSHVFFPSQSGSSSVSELKEKACSLKDEERTAHCSCFLMPSVVTSPGVLLPAHRSLSSHFSLISPYESPGARLNFLHLF